MKNIGRWLSKQASSSARRQISTCSFSDRVLDTDAPCIVATKKLMAGKSDVLSLAQGVVHWPPPESALQHVQTAIQKGYCSSYGPAEGLPQLKEKLKEKVDVENGLKNHDVMITAGANQAFANVHVALCDSDDDVILFKPYYFNHLMAIQMTGGGKHVVMGQCARGSMHPDLDWLEGYLAGAEKKPKMVVIVNPCNPTGVLMNDVELQRASDLCGKYGSWLVLDNTYEHFVYDDRKHTCISAPHVLHIFSFSKAYGMMGWRIGYIAFQQNSELASQLLKVQDTLIICAPQVSQYAALGALEPGRSWVTQRVSELESNRRHMIEALAPLGGVGSGIAGGEGAIYLWAQLPEGVDDDMAVCKYLVDEHGVCIIPGSSCGAPGYIRAAYANLLPPVCEQAANRLNTGLLQIVTNGEIPTLSGGL